MELRLGFLASHNGTNMQAILDACKSGFLKANPEVIISNNSKSGALARANKEGIPGYHLSGKTHPEPTALDDAILETLVQHDANLVVLAGYMKKLGLRTLTQYRNRILNIHPALLPRFGGKGMFGASVHKAVLDAGEACSGVTIHIVDEDYDHGSIVAQRKVKVMSDDTVETLAARVLELEHHFFPEVLQKIVEDKIILPE